MINGEIRYLHQMWHPLSLDFPWVKHSFPGMGKVVTEWRHQNGASMVEPSKINDQTVQVFQVWRMVVRYAWELPHILFKDSWQDEFVFVPLSLYIYILILTDQNPFFGGAGILMDSLWELVRTRRSMGKRVPFNGPNPQLFPDQKGEVHHFAEVGGNLPLKRMRVRKKKGGGMELTPQKLLTLR